MPSVTPETQKHVNEQDDKKGMIYLGLSMDELIRILDKNDMGHAKIEDSEGSGDYVIESGWNNSYIGIYFDGETDRVDGIEVSGPEPVPATATQKGLNIGNSLEKMVELYGYDYITDTIEFTNGDTYTIYTYKLGDHNFDVEFSSDGVRSWRIRELPPDWHYYLKKDGLYRTDQNTGDIIKINGQTTTGGLIITEDWVYYRADSRIWRMDNENKREQLTEEDWWNPSLSGGWLYCINASGIARMKPDGSEKEQIVECTCNEMVVTDQYVFYALDVPEIDELLSEPGAEDGPRYIGELHRADLNGKGDVKIKDMINDFSAYKNTVYFTDDEDGNFYSMNPETLEKDKIEEIWFVQESYFDSGYVFVETLIDRKIYKLSLTDGTLTKLTNAGFNRCLGVLDGYVYVDINSVGPDEDGLYRIKIDGVEMEKV
ncbi:MAG: DUF5050 domain-containing protein [Clostridiales bacterium]|nr:DUF5050 domain-containing protein [Clostridiales bacterium]